MGFQKKNISSRSEKVDFFESCGFLRQCLLKILLPAKLIKIKKISSIKIEISAKTSSFIFRIKNFDNKLEEN
jgi:hypothetical protein